VTTDDAALFAIHSVADAKAKADSPGPIYQGTGKAIRHLAKVNATDDDPKGLVWQARMAATISQARSLAASIDRESGRDPERKQASGVSLAALHQQLDALMLRLDPQGVATEGPADFDQLSAELAALELEQRRRVMEGGTL
jgi:hypothetical protein